MSFVIYIELRDWYYKEGGDKKLYFAYVYSLVRSRNQILHAHVIRDIILQQIRSFFF